MPEIAPGSGNVAAGQLVTLANPNAGAAIYFTLDARREGRGAHTGP